MTTEGHRHLDTAKNTATHVDVPVAAPPPGSHPSGVVGEAMSPVDVADRYRLLIEHTPDAICVHQHGHIVYMNPAGLRYLQATDAGQVLGRPITDFIAADSIGPMLARIAALRTQGQASESSEATIIALDGSTVAMDAVSVRTSWNTAPAFQVILRDMTDHHIAQEAVRRQAALVEHVSDAIIGVSEYGDVTSWNPAATAMYHRTPDHVIGDDIASAVGAPCDVVDLADAGGRQRSRHRSADGTVLSVTTSAARTREGFVLVCADHSAERRAEEHFTAVVESLEEGVVVLDHRGCVTSANAAATTILGIEVGTETAGNAAQLPFRVYGTDGSPITPSEHPVALTRQSGAPSTAVIGIERRSDGHRFWLSLTATFLDRHDPLSLIVASFSDITEPYRTSIALEHAATHDHLTGLPNRLLLLDRLDTELSRPGRAQDVAVLFIDLDDFKSINDSHGHGVGDAVLKKTADRLARALPPKSVVGRIGGDEFVAVVPDGRARVKTVRAALSRPMTIATITVVVSASIGCVTVEPDDPRTALDILHDADLQMYRAKPAVDQAPPSR